MIKDLTKTKEEYGKAIISMRVGMNEIIAELIEATESHLVIRNPIVILVVQTRPGQAVVATTQWGIGTAKDDPVVVNLGQITAHAPCTNPDVARKYIAMTSGIEIPEGGLAVDPSHPRDHEKVRQIFGPKGVPAR